MKFRITPLLIVSIGIIIYGLLLIFAGIGGNMGPMFGFMFVPVGVLVLIIYFILRGIFRASFWRQFLIESILLGVISLSYYRVHERILLHITPEFQGYIVLVYGVNNKPEIKNNSLFNPDIDILVPDNGIILTSSNRKDNLRLVDKSTGSKKILKPGYGFSFQWDTLNCANKEYTLDIIYFAKKRAGRAYISDSDRANRILKKDLIRKILSE